MFTKEQKAALRKEFQESIRFSGKDGTATIKTGYFYHPKGGIKAWAARMGERAGQHGAVVTGYDDRWATWPKTSYMRVYLAVGKTDVPDETQDHLDHAEFFAQQAARVKRGSVDEAEAREAAECHAHAALTSR